MKALLPIRNLRPDWQQMPFLVTGVAERRQDRTEVFSTFFERMVHEFRLSAEALYVGDSCTDIAVLADQQSATKKPFLKIQKRLMCRLPEQI